jgi:hypothetical protein
MPLNRYPRNVFLFARHKSGYMVSNIVALKKAASAMLCLAISAVVLFLKILVKF